MKVCRGYQTDLTYLRSYTYIVVAASREHKGVDEGKKNRQDDFTTTSPRPETKRTKHNIY